MTCVPPFLPAYVVPHQPSTISWCISHPINPKHTFQASLDNTLAALFQWAKICFFTAAWCSSAFSTLALISEETPSAGATKHGGALHCEAMLWKRTWRLGHTRSTHNQLLDDKCHEADKECALVMIPYLHGISHKIKIMSAKTELVLLAPIKLKKMCAKVKNLSIWWDVRRTEW